MKFQFTGKWIEQIFKGLRQGVTSKGVVKKAVAGAVAEEAANVVHAVGNRAVANVQAGRLNEAAVGLLTSKGNEEKLEGILRLAEPKLAELPNPHSVGRQFAKAWAQHAVNSDEWAEQHWADVLAGEAETPGKYSLFALATLANMSKEDMENFTLLAACQWNVGIVAWQGWTRELLDYNELMLERCGLVEINPGGTWHSPQAQQEGTVHYFGRSILLRRDNRQGIPLGRVYLTLTGKELIGLCNAKPNWEYMERCIQEWRNQGLVVDPTKT